MQTRQLPKTNKIADDVVDDYSPEAEQQLLVFCEEQIEKMRKYAKLFNEQGQIGFYELNQAQAEYQSVNLALIYLNLRAKIEATKAHELWEEWYAERYVDEREILNPRSLSAQKWLGAKEIEMHVRIKYREEYRALKMSTEMAEHRVALMRRLLESWERHSFTLGQLSRNVIAEIGGTGHEN